MATWQKVSESVASTGNRFRHVPTPRNGDTRKRTANVVLVKRRQTQSGKHAKLSGKLHNSTARHGPNLHQREKELCGHVLSCTLLGQLCHSVERAPYGR